jgi:hypothetical protein
MSQYLTCRGYEDDLEVGSLWQLDKWWVMKRMPRSGFNHIEPVSNPDEWVPEDLMENVTAFLSCLDPSHPSLREVEVLINGTLVRCFAADLYRFGKPLNEG